MLVDMPAAQQSTIRGIALPLYVLSLQPQGLDDYIVNIV
ncbi:hypothetical protein [Klebsiella pneumoniae IS10]|nr:hypothetical protein [Klebsiella pneumoniae IS10]